MQRLKLFIPLVLFVALAGLFFSVLKDDSYDPQALPSALIDKPLPAFNLPLLADESQLVSAENLKGEVALLNVWATWCGSCRVEHPYLNRLAKQEGVVIYGLNYKDDSDEARKWLQSLGNPYRLNIVDKDGRLGLDLGVYGAPETYLVDKDGVIRFKHVGVVDDRVWLEKFKPRIEHLRGVNL